MHGLAGNRPSKRRKAPRYAKRRKILLNSESHFLNGTDLANFPAETP